MKTVNVTLEIHTTLPVKTLRSAARWNTILRHAGDMTTHVAQAQAAVAQAPKPKLLKQRNGSTVAVAPLKKRGRRR